MENKIAKFGSLPIYSLLFIIFSFSCRSIKQSPVITDQKDSVVITKIITEYKELKDTILIINPCDSNGILKPFRERIKGQQGEVTISGKKGKLQAIVHYYPYINSNEYRIEYKYITKTIYRESETKKIGWFQTLINQILIILILLAIGLQIFKRFFA
jgi:hypothetical protein